MSPARRWKQALGEVGVLLFCVSTALWAQGELGGRLRGVITDPSGAAVSDAQVSLIDRATGLTRTGATNEEGEYSFVEVAPAAYRLRVEKAGFRIGEFEDVVIALNELRELDVQLQLGAHSDTVIVTQEAVSVVPQETSLGGLADPRRMKELPLNGRNFQQLVLLQPGVAAWGGTGNGFPVSGARLTANGFLLDGGDVNDPDVPFNAAMNQWTSGVPVDAIAEFSVITSNAPAEFGRNSGAVVNIITRNGTNNFHGSLWEFLRNDALDARSFFDPPSGKPPLRLNQFGLVLGGPIRKDQTFFLGSYEGFRESLHTGVSDLVPTPALLSAVTNPLLRAIMSAAYPQPTSSPANSFIGTFNTTVNQSRNQDSYFVRLDHEFRQSHQFFSSFQATNGPCALGCDGGTGIPGTDVGQEYRNYHFAFNYNWIISPQKLNTFRFSFQRNRIQFTLEPQPAAVLQSGTQRTAGPFQGQPFDPSPSSPNGFPTIFLPGLSSLGLPSNMPQKRAANTFHIQDTLSWNRGRHLLKAGVELRRVQLNTVFSASIRPTIGLGSLPSAMMPNPSCSLLTGCVMSQVQNFFVFDHTPLRGYRFTEFDWFVEDSYRISPRFSLDYGLRYELNLPPTEVSGAISNAYVIQNGRPVGCQPLPKGAAFNQVAIVVPSQFGIDLFCTDRDNFAPRTGFAWDLFGRSRTVLRGAYGIYYDRVFDQVFDTLDVSPPFVVPTVLFNFPLDGTMAPSTLGPTNVVSPTTVDPSLRTAFTQRWNLTLSQQLDRDTVLNLSYVGAFGDNLLDSERPNFGDAFAKDFRPSNQPNPATLARSPGDIIGPPFGAFTSRTSAGLSRYHALELEVLRRFSKGLTFQGAYTWSHGLDNITEVLAQDLDSPFPPATLNNLLAPLFANPKCSPSPGQNIDNPTTDQNFLAALNCAGFPFTPSQVNQAAAIFSGKFLTVANPRDNYGDSSIDVRHRVAINAIYELPFGRGMHFLSGATGATDKLVSGWQVAGIFVGQTGNPLPILAGIDANKDGDANDRVILTGNLENLLFAGGEVGRNPTTGAPQELQCLSSAAPNLACPVAPGDGIVNPRLRLGRGAIRTPGQANLDLQLAKRTQLTERFALQFRSEFFNVPNRTNFFAPNNVIVPPSSFGLIRRAHGGGRQIQFALKLEF